VVPYTRTKWKKRGVHFGSNTVASILKETGSFGGRFLAFRY